MMPATGGTRADEAKPDATIRKPEAAQRVGDDDKAAAAMRQAANPFGDGQASRRIAQAVLARLAVPTPLAATPA